MALQGNGDIDCKDRLGLSNFTELGQGHQLSTGVGAFAIATGM